MSKKKTQFPSKVVLPIVLALIACCGTVVAAFINSDLLIDTIARFYPTPESESISVHVADKSGTSIPGAKVLFFYSAGSLSQYTDSGGVSTFALGSDVKGNVRLIVETDKYQVYEKQITYPLETTVDVRLSEKQGSRENVILRVVRETDNQPVAGIEVIISYNGEINRQATDSDGFATYKLPFDSDGKLDAQISIEAQGYKIENQFSTLTPGKLQYILLTPNSLTVATPNIAVSGDTSMVPNVVSQVVPDKDDIIGTGVEIRQVTGKGLKVVLLEPDSQPWEGAYVRLYEQLPDANGNPSLGKQLMAGHINRQGDIVFDVQSGMYAICPDENRGYGWMGTDCIYDVQVGDSAMTEVRLQEGQIEFAIVDAGGKPWEGNYVEVFTQKLDAVGNSVIDRQVWYGHTKNTGIVNAWLTPGIYAISTDLRGYNWGDLADKKGSLNIVVKKGTKILLTIKMGKLVIGLTKPDGSPNTGIYVQIYTQKNDVNGKPATSDNIWSGHTDNGGLASIDLTQGKYAVKIGNNIVYDVPVVWGVITQTDGVTYSQKK